MALGPEPMGHEARLALAHAIAAAARDRLGGDLLAAGIYGSLARGSDGPYSDIEMLCVLRTSDADLSHEWCTGPWKAEVNLLGRDTVLAQAAEVDERWPLTHGAFVHVLPLHDPEGFFPELRATALGQPRQKFAAAMRGLIVGELYEWVGKLRNARHRGETIPLPRIALDMALHGAFLIALAERHLYSTGSKVFAESLGLSGRPEGYDALCGMAMTGTLSDGAAVATACEGFWAGVLAWAAERGLRIIEERRVPF